MPENLIEIKNLRTYFHLAEGIVRAVDGVDLVIPRMKTLGIVGESGCGKSIMSLSTLRLLPPAGRIEEGQILYHRASKEKDSKTVEVIDIAKLDPNGKEMRDIRGNHISMVFQEPMTAMSPVLTIGRQISEAVILHRKVSKAEAKEITIDMLARVRMPKPDRVFDDYPFQLSGGMRQRAVIAMGLVCRPHMLIADEPTTALDVTTEAQILHLMKDLQQEFGMAILYITHNLGVIAEMAEEVAVMYLGKVVEQTDIKSIFYKPLHPYTRGLLRSIPQLKDVLTRHDETRRLQTIQGMVPDPYHRLRGCPFHPRCPEAMTGICDKVEPAVTQVEEGHIVRCHLYQKESVAIPSGSSASTQAAV